jgi:hypothetical protein
LFFADQATGAVSRGRRDDLVHLAGVARRPGVVGREDVDLAGEVLAEAEDVVSEARTA